MGVTGPDLVQPTGPALAGRFFIMRAWVQGAGCVEAASVSLKALPATGGKAMEGGRAEEAKGKKGGPP